MLRDTSIKSLSEIITEIDRASLNGPVYVFRKQMIQKAVQIFLKGFKGTVAYAVKVNPDEMLLSNLYDLGIKRFDVASLREIETVGRLLPKAKLYFMNPIKSRIALKKAYFDFGVRDFVVDSFDELAKIKAEIHPNKDIALYVRLTSPLPSSYPHRKFGIERDLAPKLLKDCQASAERIGVCFNLGSEIMDPKAYADTIGIAASVIKEADVKIQLLDVGGGFPSAYANIHPSAPHHYFDAIHNAFEDAGFQCELLCEPGRAIVSEAGSIIARVELRKGQYLYLNDGRYGNLFDAADEAIQFPVRLHRPGSSGSARLVPFSFYGPTCDSYDFLRGPFMLPEDAREGDYIEIGQMGAYCLPMSTHFNGFGGIERVFLTDDSPILTTLQP